MNEKTPICVDSAIWDDIKNLILDECIDGRVSEGWAATHLQVDRLAVRQWVNARTKHQAERIETFLGSGGQKDHSGTKRGFIYSNKVWYAPSAMLDHDEIMFGLYVPGGVGTTGEMKMRWVQLDEYYPQLCVFDSGWSALAQFDDLLADLAEVDDQNITPDEFVELLLACGFEDMTPYQRPEHLLAHES